MNSEPALPVANASTGVPGGDDIQAFFEGLPQLSKFTGVIDAGLPQSAQRTSQLPDSMPAGVLDEGFELVDLSTPRNRDTAMTSMAVIESSLRIAGATEPRGPSAEVTNPAVPGSDRSGPLPEHRPALATAKLDVWMRGSDELPEHILHHVGRLHAQSLRLHAARFTDLVQRLTLSLHPDDLGQIDVQFKTGDHMSLTFHAREGATRELIEQNLPRLRQLFESQGITLGDVNVGSGSTAARQGRDELANGFARAHDAAAGTAPVEDAPAETRHGGRDRLIDIRA